MASIKKKTTTATVRKPRVKQTEQHIAVSGDEETFSVPVVSNTSKTTKKKTVVKKQPVPKVTSVPILLSVSIDDSRTSKVARYAGLFFMLVGACFASYSIGGLYVETVELSVSNHIVSNPSSRYVAQTITGTGVQTMNTGSVIQPIEPIDEPIVVPQTTTTVAPPPPQPVTTTVTNTSAVTYTASTTHTPVTTTTVQPTATPSTDVTMSPTALLTLKPDTAVSGNRMIGVAVERADLVELILVQRTSLKEKYLGRAHRVDTTHWMFGFDSTQVPNSEYKLFARITNKYGSYQSNQIFIRVFNAPTLTPVTASTSPANVEVAEIKTSIATVVNELEQQEPPRNLSKEITEIVEPTKTVASKPVIAPTTTAKTVVGSTTDEKEVPPDPVIVEKTNPFLSNLEIEFGQKLELYAVALRVNDSTGILRMKDDLKEFERQNLDRVNTELVTDTDNSGETIQKVRERISEILRTEIERTEKQERIILDRVGQKVARDSDRDGVSDYDEQSIYMTDPYVADTDNDGFTDGAEILGGFSPIDEENEVVMAFEDPRSEGPVRSDILSVERLDTLGVATEEGTPEVDKEQKIIFSGKALPNSFLSIYIYSTPIIVTVKTSADGSWNYSFDKEIEDGQHHMYIGMTDNAGRLIAKSAPFPFIKTANAYVGGTVTSEAPEVADVSPQLFSKNALILTIALVVVMLGLVLVLLGAYLSHRQKPQTTELEAVTV